MAAVNTVDLSRNLLFDHDTTENTATKSKHKYTIEEFHSRSNLFPSSCKSKLFLSRKDTTEKNVTNCKQQETLPSCKGETIGSDKKHVDIARKPPPGKSSYGRRIQSAKGRIEKVSVNTEKTKQNNYDKVYNHPLAWEDIPKDNGPDQVSDPGVMFAVVPVNGKQMPVVDIGDTAPFPTYNYQDKKSDRYIATDIKPFLPATTPESFHILRPSSAKCSRSQPYNDLEGIQKVRPSSAKKVTEKVDVSTKSKITPAVYGLQNSRQVFGEDNVDTTENINKETSVYKMSADVPVQRSTKSSPSKPSRVVPSSIEPLLPWMTTTLTKEDIGIDPSKCLIFLPLLSASNYSDLPEVPPPHSIDEDLPYKEKLVPTEPTIPKKYDHPSLNKKPVQEWVCQHRKSSTASAFDLNEFCNSRRSISAVRKEIADLENLMKGIGTFDSDCGLVQYQAEIEQLRQLFRETMDKVPERLRHPPPPPVDTFGLRQFYKEHDEIMLGIRERHALCLEELAELETDVGIESDRKYFKHHVIKIPDVQ